MQPTSKVHTLPVDESGEIGLYNIASYQFDHYRTVALKIDGSDAASYRVEFGGKRADDEDEIYWFDDGDQYAYESTDTVRDNWQQAEAYLRIVVTDPASSGSTAEVLVARGR